MTVCTDGKSHYVVIVPHARVSNVLYYGDGKDLSEVRSDAGGMLPGTDFLEPRFPLPTANPSFRGLDMRMYSSVEYKAETSACTLRCGSRTVALSVLPAAKAQPLLGAATFRQSPRTREPHLLARDDQGTYYYVDRGATPETQASFRVFVGRKGALKLQQMKDVAADSEGEVYSTTRGDLRLVTSQKDLTWVQRGKQTKLLALPVRDNLTLIYTTLGVYTGQRLGTPCDDL